MSVAPSTEPNLSTNRKFIESAVDDIDRNLNAALYDVGFLKGTVNNPKVGEKIRHSFSGHALDIAIRAVVQKSLMFVTRSWDTNADSIPNIVKRLPGLGEEFEAERLARRPDFPKDFLELGEVEAKITELVEDTRSFQQRADLNAALIHRDERIAHMLIGKSGLRRKLEREGIETDAITYDQVILLAEDTAEMFTRIIQIVRYNIKDSTDWIESSQRYTSLFWDTLPILSEAESLQ